MYLPQRFEQGLILLVGPHGNSKKIGTEVMEGPAVPDEDPPGDQSFPELGRGQVQGRMQLNQKVIGGAGIGNKAGNSLQAMDEISPFLADASQRSVGIPLVLKTFHGGQLGQRIDRPGVPFSPEISG